jgi:hypothetical protein
MKTYIFYSKNDPNQEPIGSTLAQTHQEATQMFAKIKKLTIEEFTKLFNVEKRRR